MPGPPWSHRRLRNRGFRLTLPRQAVLNIFNQNPRHLTAEEVFFLVHRNYPGIGLATVYRTLNLLTQMRLVHKFNFGDGRNRYELASKFKKKYHHLVCVQCGKIIDYDSPTEKEADSIKEIEKELANKYKFKINSYQIHFYGVCKDCQNKQGGE